MIRLVVKEAAERAGCETMYQLMKATNLPWETVRRLWRGQTIEINLTTLDKLCQGLDAEPGDFFLFKRESPRKQNKLR